MLPGGTDQDCGEGHYPALLLTREAVADAVYGARAWAQTVSWSVVLGGVGSILTGLSQHNAAALASGVTAVVVAFIPRARPLWVYAVAQTWAMRQGWGAVPASERPFEIEGDLPDRALHVSEYEVVRRSPKLPERERPN